MEQLKVNSAVTRQLADLDVFHDSPLHLMDVGCSGGIASGFREFGPEGLVALGIDPNKKEIERLQLSETFPGVAYLAARCGLVSNDSIFSDRDEGDFWSNNPWERLSTAFAVDFMAQRVATDDELTQLNEWNRLDLVDPHEVFTVDELVKKNLESHVDFLKVDVDGADLVVLHSALAALNDPTTLGVGVEVTFFGSSRETDNTFHNVDRLLREFGFELFDLTTRRYSNAALPSRFLLDVPAQTLSGRIFQGDALYFRDIGGQDECAPQGDPLALLKLACLFDLFGLPDCSAEVLAKRRTVLQEIVDVDGVLDALVRSEIVGFTRYDEYMRHFMENPLRLARSSWEVVCEPDRDDKEERRDRWFARQLKRVLPTD